MEVKGYLCLRTKSGPAAASSPGRWTPVIPLEFRENALNREQNPDYHHHYLLTADFRILLQVPKGYPIVISRDFPDEHLAMSR